MKKSRWWSAVGAAMALSMGAAAPALAHDKPGDHSRFGGEQVMALNADLDTNENLYGCDGISWFGTVDLYGETYGMALYSISGEVRDDGLYYYEEGWRIFSGKFRVNDGELKRCHPGRVVAAGTDMGVWDIATGDFESEGSVDKAKGWFTSWYGKTVMQDGVAPQPVSVAGLDEVPGLIGRLWLEDPRFGGEQVMALNADLDTNENLYGCDGISWFGTVELYGKTYGMALYSISGEVRDDGLYYYEEGWRIFTREFRVNDGELKRCHPGRVVAAGTDMGVWDIATGDFESEGSVDKAKGWFTSWYGKTVMQDGVAPQPVSVAGLDEVPGLIGRMRLDPSRH